MNKAVPRRRWGIAILLGFGVLVNYFDRVNLSVSRDALHEAFGMSTVTFGFLLSAYNWTYAALQLPSGLLLDRFGVRRVGIVSTVIWSVASFAAAISTGVGSLFGARFLLGIGEAPTFPANSKATGYWFPKNERSLATAMFDSAAKFSSAIGIPVLGLLLLRFGWRWNFAATGFISLLYFALFYAIYRNPSDDKLLTTVEREFIARGGAQQEDRARAASGACWRNNFWSGNSRHGARTQSCDGAFLDQHVDRRIVRGFTGGVVDSVADRSTRKRRHTRGNSEFLQSTCWDCCAYFYGLHRTSDTFFRWSVYRCNGFSGSGDRGICFPAGTHQSDS